jgi:hypothetical protein
MAAHTDSLVYGTPSRPVDHRTESWLNNKHHVTSQTKLYNETLTSDLEIFLGHTGRNTPMFAP